MASFCYDFKGFLKVTKELCDRRCTDFAFTKVVKGTWEILLRQGLTLRDSFPRVGHLDDCGQRCFFILKDALFEALKFVNSHVLYLSSSVEADNCVYEDLRLGLGSPSTTGCLDTHGVTVKLHVLVHHPTSIEVAFAKTGLHAIDLAGVRLPIDFHLPAHYGYRLISVGQADYNSVAVAMRNDFADSFSKVSGVGDRRLWLRAVSSEVCFFWLIFYLPANNEAYWYEEVSGIDLDIASISSNIGSYFSIFWLGDANLQPAALGKGADCKPSRDRRWEALVKKWSVFLWNPIGFGRQPCSLFLP